MHESYGAPYGQAFLVLHTSGVGARFFLDRYTNCGSGYGHAHGRDLSLKAFYVGPLTGMGQGILSHGITVP